MNKTALLKWMETEPVICSHSHHLPDSRHLGMGLADLLNNTYVAWCGVPVPDDSNRDDVAAWLRAVGTRSYFVWLEKALMALYGLREPLSADSLHQYDQAIRMAHQAPDWHLKLLKEHCRYEAAFLDCYWAPGDDNGHPELFRSVYRVNSMFYGYNPSAADHNGNNIQALEGTQITDLDAYIRLIRRVLSDRKNAGCAAFKCALAYDRGLDFGRADKTLAQRAMGDAPEEAEIRAFQNHVMDTICETAAELKIPLQMHTGLGKMENSNAMQLAPLIARHEKTTFILMHGGYPWLDDVAGLCHVFPNVWADICWLPLISVSAAKRLLHELIDVCNADRVIWGCDAWTGEESYAARLAFFEALSSALCERVEAGMMREGDAYRYAGMVLHGNARQLIRQR